MPDKPFGPDDVTRAIELMRNAGWLASVDVGGDFTGLRLTKAGQQQAATLYWCYKELRCESARDLQLVLGAIEWYFDRDDIL